MLERGRVVATLVGCSPRARRSVSTAASASFDFDTIVIGGGAIGLAAARARLLRRPHERLAVVEAESDVGRGVSSRSSQVVHAGLYYPQGSLKAKACVEGRVRLLEYCERNRVPVNLCGKFIVASSLAARAKLDEFRRKALANGVPESDLEILSESQAKALEPDLHCPGGVLHSKGTAIFDAAAYVDRLRADVEAHEFASVVPNTRVVRAEDCASNGFKIWMGDSSEAVTTQRVVNAAGLYAVSVARSFAPPRASLRPYGAHFCKGNYFKLENKSECSFQRLIYPMPEAHGLGVHLTLDMEGNVRFGPDVEWSESPDDFRVDEARAAKFERAVRDYWPTLRPGALVPDYAGIRPKLGPETTPAFDFVLLGPRELRRPHLVHCLGIESPGLTSSLSLAETIADMLEASESDV